MLRSGFERLRGRSWPAILSCVLGVALSVAMCCRLKWTLDDAYITFAYAKNWLRGYGVVFNAGERVEGYTSFSWVALSALGLALGVDIERWSWALGTLAAAGTIVASWALARSLLPEQNRAHAGFAALAVGAYAPFAFWGASGMETTFFSLLVTLAFWRHALRSESWTAPSVTAIAAMTRPEGALVALVLAAHTSHRDGWRSGSAFLGRFFGIFAPYWLWRFWYYGRPLPNTFYAKVGGSLDQVHRGVEYLVAFLVEQRAAPIVLLAFLSLFTASVRRAAPALVFLALYVVYVVVVGGDAFPSARFLVTVFPLFASLAAVSWSAGFARSRAPLTIEVCFAIGLGLVWVPLFFAQTHRTDYANVFLAFSKASCADIKGRTRPSDAIASLGVGFLKFCTDARVVDMLGITDAHIASVPAPQMGTGCAGHERYDSRYVIAQSPLFILVPPPSIGSFYGCELAAVQDIWRQPEIGRQYVTDVWGLRRADVPRIQERSRK